MATAGTLTTVLGLDARRFQSGLNNARKSVVSFASDVTRIVTGIQLSNVFDSAAAGLRSMVVSTVKLAADAETSRIQFEVLTGDIKKGTALFKDIEKFAGRTSFSLESAADATKRLLASGINESDVMRTMQLLGDLAMGDANKLGFLSKAYTDVLNKGKLQAQELRQFAENGVGLIQPLAKMFNKTAGEILEMSEAGEISFQDMQKALESLTGEGGRFHGMMDRVNKTFTGQWNSMIESVQTLGREIGAAVLPELTKMVSGANDVLQKFTEMPDKMKFVGDVLDASFDVAFQHILKNWDKMLEDMNNKASAKAKELMNSIFSLEPERALLRKIGLMDPAEGPAAKPADPLGEAKGRLDALMGQLGIGVPKKPFQFVGPQEGFEGVLRNMREKNRGNVGGLFGDIGNALEGPLADLKMKGQGIFDRLKLDGNWLGGVVSNMFTGDGRALAKKEPQTAGAMEKGSAEAFSTIVANLMGNGKKDPAVAAIEKQTKDLVKGLKPKPGEMPFQVVEAFL